MDQCVIPTILNNLAAYPLYQKAMAKQRNLALAYDEFATYNPDAAAAVNPTFWQQRRVRWMSSYVKQLLCLLR